MHDDSSQAIITETKRIDAVETSSARSRVTLRCLHFRGSLLKPNGERWILYLYRLRYLGSVLREGFWKEI